MRWLRDHPLTAADLQQEIEYLRGADFRLRIFTRASRVAVDPSLRAA